MSDNYQAVYDAIRSRFYPPDMERIAREQFDTSFMQDQIKNAFGWRVCRSCERRRTREYMRGVRAKARALRELEPA